MYRKAGLVSSFLLALVAGQQVGTNTLEVHPPLTVQKCTKAGGCVSSTQSVVLDANWRWVHETSGYTNCYTGNQWDSTVCSDPAICAANCALEGASYASTYGITTSGGALTQKFISGNNAGSRVYLMDEDDTDYQMFDLNNQEFTFDIDMSTLPCGLNGALYFSEMDADGGMSRFPTNKAGAKYGTGYCDAQCPHDIKFVNGQANTMGWNATTAHSGVGRYGSCCIEMDIWEANVNDAAYTPHVCSINQQTQSETNLCDEAGCDFNSYRNGNTTFLGPGKIVDTTKPFTVVTQFITADSTMTGKLTEIRRLYVQNGQVINNSNTNIAGMPEYNSISDAYCAAESEAFGETTPYTSLGGLATMGAAFIKGMVLVMSVWDDYDVNMLWLDSDYPTDQPTAQPGTVRGPCSITSGAPAAVEAAGANVQVVYSNIKWGEIGSTFTGGQYIPPGGGSPPASSSSVSAAPSTMKTSTTSAVTATSSITPMPTTSSPSPKPSGCTTAKYAQCGGIEFDGCVTCAVGSFCTFSNLYYSQCL